MPFSPDGGGGEKEVVSFRCPADLYDWLQSRRTGRLKLGTVARWAAEMGREYVEVALPLAEKIERYSSEEGMTRAAYVRHLLELGMASYERGRRGR